MKTGMVKQAKNSQTGNDAAPKQDTPVTAALSHRSKLPDGRTVVLTFVLVAGLILAVILAIQKEYTPMTGVIAIAVAAAVALTGANLRS